MPRVRVLCQLVVEVELSEEDYKRRHFIIEENGCPGTGVVGAALEAVMNNDDGCCWACKLGGNNVIIDGSNECRHVEIKV